MNDTIQFSLGVHVKIEDEYWLPVRFVDQSTFHEEPTTGVQFIEEEKFVEMRNKNGNARFASLGSTKTRAQRDAGPCRGIKPYFWKGGELDGAAEVGAGGSGTPDQDVVQPEQ
jgi:hypothetical protein